MKEKKNFHTLEQPATEKGTEQTSEEFFSGKFVEAIKSDRPIDPKRDKVVLTKLGQDELRKAWDMNYPEPHTLEIPLEELSAMRQSPDDDETIEELPIVHPTRAEAHANAADNQPEVIPDYRKAQALQLSPEEQAELEAIAQSQGLLQEDEEAKSPSDDELPAVKKGGLWQWVVDAFKGE